MNISLNIKLKSVRLKILYERDACNLQVTGYWPQSYTNIIYHNLNWKLFALQNHNDNVNQPDDTRGKSAKILIEPLRGTKTSIYERFNLEKTTKYHITHAKILRQIFVYTKHYLKFTKNNHPLTNTQTHTKNCTYASHWMSFKNYLVYKIIQFYIPVL